MKSLSKIGIHKKSKDKRVLSIFFIGDDKKEKSIEFEMSEDMLKSTAIMLLKD